MRVGGATQIPVDFRLVAATNRDLANWVETGRFRQDLFYRLKVVELYIPPLRERSEDIPIFVQHFLEMFNKELERDVGGVHAAVLAALKRQPWPGNVRELRNLIESTVLFARAGEIVLEDLPAEYRTPTQSAVSTESAQWHPRPMAEIEKEAILRTVGHTGGHRARAADLLEIGLRTLQRKLKEYGEISPLENGDPEGGD